MHIKHRIFKNVVNILCWVVLLYLTIINEKMTMAAPLMGADQVITQIEKSLGGDEQKKDNTAENTADILLNDILKFEVNRANLSSDEAADTWLNLYDRFWMVPQADLMQAYASPSGGQKKLSAITLISALPAPTAWDTLKKRVLIRASTSKSPQNSVLKIIVYYLTKDKANLDISLAELRASAATNGEQTRHMFANLRLNTFSAPTAKGAKGVVDSFEAYLQSLQVERPQGLLTVNVPDLINLAGEKRATSLITRAITIPGLTLRVPTGDRTLELTKRIVKINASKLVEPQWQLISSIQDLDLYEALIKRFPDKDKNIQQETAEFLAPNKERYNIDYGRIDEGRRRAKIFYTMGLIANKRVTDAVAQAKDMSADDVTSSDFDKIWQSFEKIRFANEVTQFCKELLTERPELPLWANCGVVVSTPEARQALIDIVDSAGNKSGLGLGMQVRIRERNVDVLLAMDRVEDAINKLKQIISTDASKETQAEQLAITQVKYRMIARMCELGKLLKRPDLIQQGAENSLTVIKDFSVGRISSNMNDYAASSALNEVVDTLIDSGEYASAEKIVVAMIEASAQSPQIGGFSTTREMRQMMVSSGMLAEMLNRLVAVYDRAGRPDDVIKLMERSPWWGAHDLIMVNDINHNLFPLVAKALHNVGRDAEGVEILKVHLYGYPGDDSAYRVLVDISGPALIPWLDELYERDHFEERPLIWKAYLLKQQGKLDEAEAVARRAIKIDPTDGEEKAGDRGRAYVVLSDILKARGKQDDASFFERVITSVRIAEEGDAFTKAGLLRKSLTYYERAADSFADAYCVQWRMAERLSAMGDHDGAKKHYEIAFERMPEQFGQVANFCFGCEGVFTHQQSQSVAEEVLTRLEKTAGQKPQVQFLLGQLRESQGRKSEAYHFFRKAAELDPDYLDAWKAAYELKADVFLSQDESDNIALHIIKKDPMLKHSGIDISDVFDPKGLWSVYEQASKKQARIPDHLLTLTASKTEIDAMLKKFGLPREVFEARKGYYMEMRHILEPGETVAKNRLIQVLTQYLLTASTGM
jgi:tetratricopeptide (TPR) repeat protein